MERLDTVTRWDILIDTYKIQLLTEALVRNKWNRCAVAREFGCHRNTIERNMKVYGITPPMKHSPRLAKSSSSMHFTATV